MKTLEFFSTHPGFSLDDVAGARASPGGRSGALERLKHHLESGRLSLVARGVYAVVPGGISTARFRPVPILVGDSAHAGSPCAYPHSVPTPAATCEREFLLD